MTEIIMSGLTEIQRQPALYHSQIGKGSLRHGEAGDVEGLAGQDRLDRRISALSLAAWAALG